MQNWLDTQLCEASQRGDVNGVVSMLERGANVNSTDGWTLSTSTPMYNAASNEQVEGVMACAAEVHEEVCLGHTPLHRAAMYGRVECIMALLDRGAYVDIQDIIGMTPLHSAVLGGHMECVKELVYRQADVNIKTVDGSTPLHSAAIWGHMEFIKALLGRGADANMKDIRGRSALDQALQSGHHDVVDAIRNHMSRRSNAQQDGDQRPASQNSSRKRGI
eukprot:gene2166-biopygen10745